MKRIAFDRDPHTIKNRIKSHELRLNTHSRRKLTKMYYRIMHRPARINKKQWGKKQIDDLLVIIIELWLWRATVLHLRPTIPSVQNQIAHK